MNTALFTAVTERMKDEEFAEKLLANRTKEDVQSFLAANGIDCTLEQVKELGKYLKEQFGTQELCPEQLDAVAGGGFWDKLKQIGSDVWDSITGWF